MCVWGGCPAWFRVIIVIIAYCFSTPSFSFPSWRVLVMPKILNSLKTTHSHGDPVAQQSLISSTLVSLLWPRGERGLRAGHVWPPVPSGSVMRPCIRAEALATPRVFWEEHRGIAWRLGRRAESQAPPRPIDPECALEPGPHVLWVPIFCKKPWLGSVVMVGFLCSRIT